MLNKRKSIVTFLFICLPTFLFADCDYDKKFVTAAKNGDFLQCKHILSVETLIDHSDVRTFMHFYNTFQFRVKFKKTALMASSFEGHSEIVRLLLYHRANPNLFDENGDTPLLFASEQDHPDIVSILLAASAHVNHQNNQGLSALMLACLRGNIEVIEILIDNGANPRLSTKGTTAIQLLNRSPLPLIEKIRLREFLTEHLKTEEWENGG